MVMHSEEYFKRTGEQHKNNNANIHHLFTFIFSLADIFVSVRIVRIIIIIISINIIGTT